MQLLHRLFGLLAALAFVNTAFAAPALSDRDAKVLAEEQWKGSVLIVPLGAFTVVREGFNPDKGLISTQTYDRLRIWEKLGIVSVAADEKFDNFRKGKEFSWNQWNQMTQQGVAAKITVAPSEQGRALLDPANPKQLKLSQGRFTVTGVAKNEERKKGVDDFRLVMVSYDADWTPLTKQYLEMVTGQPAADKRKAILLFKWDPFSNQWKLDASDIANANEEFKTKRVADKLGR